jgi:hypothetical protein
VGRDPKTGGDLGVRRRWLFAACGCDLIDPTIAVHHGRIVKRTGDGSIIEFRSVVDAVRCAIEVQTGRSRSLHPDLGGCMKSSSPAFAWPRASITAGCNS